MLCESLQFGKLLKKQVFRLCFQINYNQQYQQRLDHYHLFSFNPLLSGVLLLADPQENINLNTSSNIELDKSSNELGAWREEVRNDASKFIDLCLHFKLIPDLWSLYEWSNWLTPVSVGHKRFDTMFYICCLDKQLKVMVDNSETTKSKVSGDTLNHCF